MFSVKHASTECDADEIIEGLWVGSMPANKKFVEKLRDRGIDGIVSLQTNVDLLTLGFNWKQMLTLLKSVHINDIIRVQIPDFDEASLVQSIDRAITEIHSMISDRGKTAYLHCTAGINRSPTVAIAYLVDRQGFSLDQAWDFVHERRPVVPLRGALERWLQRRAKKKK